MTCIKKSTKAREQVIAVAQFHAACKPKHARFMECGEREWFEACNKEFVKAMREHYPERETKSYGSISQRPGVERLGTIG